MLMRQQDAHILDGCDQVILDLLSPESPPTSAFKVMVVGLHRQNSLPSGVGAVCDYGAQQCCEPARALHLVPLGFRAFALCAHGASECIECAMHKRHTL